MSQNKNEKPKIANAVVVSQKPKKPTTAQMQKAVNAIAETVEKKAKTIEPTKVETAIVAKPTTELAKKDINEIIRNQKSDMQRMAKMGLTLKVPHALINEQVALIAQENGINEHTMNSAITLQALADTLDPNYKARASARDYIMQVSGNKPIDKSMNVNFEGSLADGEELYKKYVSGGYNANADDLTENYVDIECVEIDI